MNEVEIARAPAALDAILRDTNALGFDMISEPIDDLSPQPNCPEGHAPKVPVLIQDLTRRADFVRPSAVDGLAVRSESDVFDFV